MLRYMRIIFSGQNLHKNVNFDGNVKQLLKIKDYWELDILI